MIKTSEKEERERIKAAKLQKAQEQEQAPEIEAEEAGAAATRAGAESSSSVASENFAKDPDKMKHCLLRGCSSNGKAFKSVMKKNRNTAHKNT